MHYLLVTALSCLVLAGCSKPHHYPGQFAGRPVRIACSSCHDDVRRSFDHKRGWCDDHTRYKRYDDVCETCHQNTACRGCHRDSSGKLIWSDMRQQRWYRPKD